MKRIQSLVLLLSLALCGVAGRGASFEIGESVVRSVATPVLDELHPEDDFNRVAREVTKFPGGAEVASGEFPNTDAAQVVMLKEPVLASQFALQALSSHDRDAKKPFASIAEFDQLDDKGEPITNAGLTVAGVDSEEEITMDGVAENAIDGQVESFWYATARALPHWIAFRTPRPVKIHGFRYTPCVRNLGRIKSWRFLVESVTFGPAEEHPFLENHLKLGGTNPDGVRIDVNSLCFTRGGRPWIPIVGELHFSRVPETDWADALRQMKLGGPHEVTWYEISAEEDGFVELAGVCDVEQLHVDGELVADFFYNGRPWRIPTKLFKGRKVHLAVASFKDNVYREW